jgi:hypothetical protein
MESLWVAEAEVVLKQEAVVVELLWVGHPFHLLLLLAQVVMVVLLTALLAILVEFLLLEHSLLAAAGAVLAVMGLQMLQLSAAVAVGAWALVLLVPQVTMVDQVA